MFERLVLVIGFRSGLGRGGGGLDYNALQKDLTKIVIKFSASRLFVGRRGSLVVRYRYRYDISMISLLSVP